MSRPQPRNLPRAALALVVGASAAAVLSAGGCGLLVDVSDYRFDGSGVGGATTSSTTATGGVATGGTTSSSGGGTGGAAIPVEVVAEGQHGPIGIALDETNVYWTTLNDGAVKKRPLAGGAVVTLASGQDLPRGIAVYEETVYWVNQSSGSNGSVMSVSAEGGGPTVIASGQTDPLRIAVGPMGIYWTCGSGNVVMARALDGAGGGGGGPVSFAETSGYPVGIAGDSVHVYWTSVNAGIVSYRPHAGGPPNLPGQLGTLAEEQDAPTGIAVGETAAYWVNSSTGSSGTVMRVLLAGGQPEQLADEQPRPDHITVDDTPDHPTLYWTNTVGGQVVRLVTNVGSPEIIVSGQASPQDLAVGATHVYWVNQGSNNDGTVMRAPK